MRPMKTLADLHDAARPGSVWYTHNTGSPRLSGPVVVTAVNTRRMWMAVYAPPFVPTHPEQAPPRGTRSWPLRRDVHLGPTTVAFRSPIDNTFHCTWAQVQVPNPAQHLGLDLAYVADGRAVDRAARIVALIMSDEGCGYLTRRTRAWTDLHGHLDPNEYLNDVAVPFEAPATAYVQHTVDAILAARSAAIRAARRASLPGPDPAGRQGPGA